MVECVDLAFDEFKIVCENCCFCHPY